MERKRKNFWVLSLTMMALTTTAEARNDSVWDDIVKKMFGKTKVLKLSAGREAKPTLKFSPKVISFKGELEIPSQIYLSSGSGAVSANAGQIIFDNQIICNYSPKSNGVGWNKIYYLRDCSDGSRAKDNVVVNNKVELKLNSASSDRASLLANVRVLSSQEVEYGLVFPYINATEGQILMFNGEAWVAADPSELNLAGLQGEQGEQGLPGAQGPQGPAGATGPAGAQGPAGEKGDKGDKGDAGVAGAPGVAGPQGPAGAVGPQGPKGDAGVAGAAGVAGPQGPVGPAGAIGPQGPKGDAGVAGAVGPQGPVGATGPQGPAGRDGVDGAPGVAGPVGPQGPKGDKGDAGVAGAAGAVGPQGPAGFQGPQGPVGPAGADGAQGIAGPVGPTGAAGPAGAKGDKGDKGDRGLSEIAYLRDQRASGVSGGSCTATAWDTRALNTLGGDTGFISLIGNQFVLQPGTYFIEIQAPAFAVGVHQAKLKVIETGLDAIYGSSNVSPPSSTPYTTYSIIQGEIVVTTASTFEIQHRCGTAKPSIGYGAPVNFGTAEIYTQVKIIKKQ